MILRFRKKLENKSLLNNVLFWTIQLTASIFASLIPTIIQLGFTSPLLFEVVNESIPLLIVTNILLYCLMLFFSILFHNPGVSSLLILGISCALGFANVQKIAYRNYPVIPSDFMQIKDAFIASKSFSLVITKSFILCLIISLFYVLILLPVHIPLFSLSKKKSVIYRIITAVLSLATAIILFFGFFFNDSLIGKFSYYFCPKAIQNEFIYNTYYPAFFRSCSVLFQPSPDGYSKKALSELSSELESFSTNENSTNADIIIIQLESFFYPDVFDIEYNHYESFGPFDELGLKGAYGYLISPQIGGGTADVEYEVLTGFTSNDKQCLINPFSIYVYDNFPSIVGYCKENGYSCISIHSYNTALYNRVNAYSNLGFEKSIFDNSFTNPEYRSSWISEKSCFDKVVEEYESASAYKTPVLIHTVTMQNHIPIDSEMYPENELVEVKSSTLSQDDLLLIKNYLTSCKEISQGLNSMADYFLNSKRNVILVAYGDHQSPNLRAVEGISDYDIPLSDDLTSLSEEDYYVVTHRTPFIVWTNFDSGLSGEDWGNISPNSLLVKALVKSGVNCPAYFRFFESNSNEIKSISANYVISPDNSLSFEMTEAQIVENHPRILIQHDILHGDRYILNSLY